MILLSPAPSIGSGRRAVYRCECGTEFTARCTDVNRGAIKSCGCLNKRFPNRRRRKEEMPDAVPVRLVRAHPLMDDARLIDALVTLLNPPFGRLPYVQPVEVAWVCRELNAEPHHVLRWPVLLAIESNGDWLWGKAIAAGDVFGRKLTESVSDRIELTACDGGRGKVAA